MGRRARAVVARSRSWVTALEDMALRDFAREGAFRIGVRQTIREALERRGLIRLEGIRWRLTDTGWHAIAKPVELVRYREIDSGPPDGIERRSRPALSMALEFVSPNRKAVLVREIRALRAPAGIRPGAGLGPGRVVKKRTAPETTGAANR